MLSCSRSFGDCSRGCSISSPRQERCATRKGSSFAFSSATASRRAEDTPAGLAGRQSLGNLDYCPHLHRHVGKSPATRPQRLPNDVIGRFSAAGSLANSSSSSKDATRRPLVVPSILATSPDRIPRAAVVPAAFETRRKAIAPRRLHARLLHLALAHRTRVVCSRRVEEEFAKGGREEDDRDPRGRSRRWSRRLDRYVLHRSLSVSRRRLIQGPLVLRQHPSNPNQVVERGSRCRYSGKHTSHSRRRQLHSRKTD
jgi:hypothetical protein